MDPDETESSHLDLQCLQLLLCLALLYGLRHLCCDACREELYKLINIWENIHFLTSIPANHGTIAFFFFFSCGIYVLFSLLHIKG